MHSTLISRPILVVYFTQECKLLLLLVLLLTHFSSNFSRVSFAICLNFLQLMNINDSSFGKAISNNNIVPIFGESFQKFFPITLAFLVVFNMLDVYGKIIRLFGLQRWDFSSDSAGNLQGEGSRIMKGTSKELSSPARIQQECEMKNSSSSSSTLGDFPPVSTLFSS